MNTNATGEGFVSVLQDTNMLKPDISTIFWAVPSWVSAATTKLKSSHSLLPVSASAVRRGSWWPDARSILAIWCVLLIDGCETEVKKNVLKNECEIKYNFLENLRINNFRKSQKNIRVKCLTAKLTPENNSRVFSSYYCVLLIDGEETVTKKSESLVL